MQESKTVTFVEYRDTTIEVPGETIVLVDSLYCDSLGNVISRLGDFIVEKDGKISRLERRLSNNVYTTKSKVDTVYIPVKGNTIYKKEIVYKKGRDIKVKYIPSWVVFFAYLGGILFIVLLLYVIIKLIKKQSIL